MATNQVPGATNGMLELPWIAFAREHLGLAEIVGSKHEPKILNMWKTLGLGGIKDDETAWCAGFTGYVLKESGLPFLKTASSRAYQHFVRDTGKGKVLDKPAYGCLIVGWTGSKSGWAGHIGFCVGEQSDKPTHVMMLAGNQGNKVSIAPFPKSQVLAYIWPSTSPTAQRFVLPLLSYNGAPATTR